jgi:hypothetical protein
MAEDGEKQMAIDKPCVVIAYPSDCGNATTRRERHACGLVERAQRLLRGPTRRVLNGDI